MKRFVEGADRGQSTLAPECLDEWVGSRSPRRVATSNSSIQPSRGRVTVPHPNKDVPIRTLRSIEKQASLKLNECKI